jgi:hypothetical protein
MPNMVAYAALLIWPFVSLALFMKLPLRLAVIWSLLGGYLLLPCRTSIDFPGLPAFDKTIIPAFSALLWTMMFAKHRVFKGMPAKLPLTLLLVFIFSPIFTTMNNHDPLVLSNGVVPGMTWYDSLSVCVRQFSLVTPFLLGYYVLAQPAGHREILVAMVLGAMAYALPMLIEVRLSPQLHHIVYGFTPSSFLQQMRGAGFRPVVFLGHGLLVATYTAMSLVAAIGLARQRVRVRGIDASFIAAGLFVLLILCKSVGALILGTIFATLLFILKPRQLVMVLAAIAVILTLYPAVRSSGLLPIETIKSMASSASSERAQSLEVRLDNEQQLLAKAGQRPFFGWGTWGRNQIFGAGSTPEKMSSITDGTWIIAIGSFGWVGYIGMFGLLCYPFLHIYRMRRFLTPLSPALPLLVVLIVNLIDLIPNSSLSPITWLIAGALSGTTAVSMAPARRVSVPQEQVMVAA